MRSGDPVRNVRLHIAHYCIRILVADSLDETSFGVRGDSNDSSGGGGGGGVFPEPLTVVKPRVKREKAHREQAI